MFALMSNDNVTDNSSRTAAVLKSLIQKLDKIYNEKNDGHEVKSSAKVNKASGSKNLSEVPCSKTAVRKVVGRKGMVAMVSVNGNSTEMQLRLKWNSGRRCALLTAATTPKARYIPITKDTSISVESGVLNVQTPMECGGKSAHVSIRFVDSANLAKWLSKLELVREGSRCGHSPKEDLLSKSSIEDVLTPTPTPLGSTPDLFSPGSASDVFSPTPTPLGSASDVLSPTPTPLGSTPDLFSPTALGSMSDVFESSEQLSDSGSDSCDSYFSEDEQETSHRDLSRDNKKSKAKSKNTRSSDNQPRSEIRRWCRGLVPPKRIDITAKKPIKKASNEKAQPAMQSTQDHRNHLRAMLQWQSGYCNALGHAVEFQKQQYKLTETLHHFDDTVHMLGARYLRLLDACNIPGLLGIALREMQRLENAWNHLQDSESETDATEVLSRACSEFALDLPRIREAMLPFCNCCGAVEGVLSRALAALLAMRVRMSNQRKHFLSALQHLKHTLNLPLEFIANLRYNWELLLLPLKQHGSGSQLKSVLGDVLAISRTCLEKAYQSKLDVLRIDVPELERLLILAANDASSIGKAPRFIHTGFFRRASSKAEGVKGLAVTLWLFPGVLIETSFTASKSRSKLGKGVIITRMRKHFVPPGRSTIEWTRYCKGSVSRMQKAVETGSVNLPAEGVYVKSAKLSKQHGRDIYFKVAPHPRGAALPSELFDGDQAENLEHAVKMHSDLSRVTTRVFLLRQSTAGGSAIGQSTADDNSTRRRHRSYFGLAYHKPHKPLLLHSEMQSEESSHVLLEAQTQIQSPRGSPGGTGMSKWWTKYSKHTASRWLQLLLLQTQTGPTK